MKLDFGFDLTPSLSLPRVSASIHPA